MVSTRNHLKPKFSIGEKVLCYEPDPLKAKVLYNSKVLKILDDKEGKRGLEFLIHFSGWNSTWDRYVTEDFILKDTEENRKLQQELAEKAQLTPGGNLYRREQRRSKKHHHLHYHRHRKPSSSSLSPHPPYPDEMSFENGHTTVEPCDQELNLPEDSSSTDRTDTMSSCSDSENINSNFPPTCRGVVAALPLNQTLKAVLTNDHMQVKQNNMVVQLLASPSIVEILERFYRQYAALEINAFPNRTPSSNENQPPTLKDLMKSLNSLIHIVDGIRLYFDFSVKKCLLYNNEHKQFDFYKRNPSTFRSNVLDSGKKEPIRSPPRSSQKEDHGLMNSIGRLFSSVHSALSFRGTMRDEMRPGVKEGGGPPSATSAYKERMFTSVMRRDNLMSKEPHVIPPVCTEDVTIKEEVQSADEDDYEPQEKKPFLPFESDRGHDRKPIEMRSYSPNRRERISHVLSSLSQSEGNVLNNHTSSESNILSNHSSETGHQRLDSVSSVDSTMSGRTTSSVSSGVGVPPYLLHWDQTRSSLLDKLDQWVFIPDHVLATSPPLPSSIYGAVHLTRLFVRLPSMLSASVLSDEKIEYILEVTQDLAEFMSQHEEWFRTSAYVNNTF